MCIEQIDKYKTPGAVRGFTNTCYQTLFGYKPGYINPVVFMLIPKCVFDLVPNAVLQFLAGLQLVRMHLFGSEYFKLLFGELLLGVKLQCCSSKVTILV